MKKNVDVIVTGIHSRVGEPTEKIVTNSVGVFEEKEDGMCILEYDEEQDAGGGTVKIHNKVSIAPDGKGMEIIRGGDIKSKLAFADKLEYDTEYNTPYGSMQMKVRTNNFDFIKTRQEEDMKLMAEYVLEMEGEVLSDSILVIEIKNSEA